MIEYDATTLRELQLEELELLKEVDRICRLYKIKYSLDGGTLLGAVRHKGFIPWDDDADVNFTREEYIKFYKACKKSLDISRFFLMDFRTDPYYRWGFSKLQLLNTEFLREGQETSKWPQRVNIDIFIMDNAPDNYLWRRIHYLLGLIIKKGLYSEFGRLNEKNIFFKKIYQILHIIPRNTYVRMVEGLAKITNSKETELVRPFTLPYTKNTNRKLCKYGVPRKLFAEYQDIEFEGHQFRAFKDPDLYLRYVYDDYMKLPPMEKRSTHAPTSKIKLLNGVCIEQHKR